MGLTWAAAWALAGLLIGVASLLTPFLPWDVFFDHFDAPLPSLALPGFIGGAIFSVVLGIAGRRRRFQDLSMRRFVAWGGLGGLLLGLVPATMVALGLASVNAPYSALGITLGIVPPLMLLGAASAGGSLAIARRSAAALERGAAPHPEIEA
jgi:hypothetical protein